MALIQTAERQSAKFTAACNPSRGPSSFSTSMRSTTHIYSSLYELVCGRHPSTHEEMKAPHVIRHVLLTATRNLKHRHFNSWTLTFHQLLEGGEHSLIGVNSSKILL